MNPRAWASNSEQTDGNTFNAYVLQRRSLYEAPKNSPRGIGVQRRPSVSRPGGRANPDRLLQPASSDLTIVGDVQMIEGEFYFVKDTTGHQVRLHVNNQTKLEDRIKVGDKIEARVTSEGHATSITLQIPQNGTAPPLPNTSPTSP